MRVTSPILYTRRLIVRMADYRDAGAIAQFYKTNRAFLQPFEPERPDEFFTEAYWQFQVQHNQLEFESGHSLKFFLFEQDKLGSVLGTLNFHQIFRGVFHSCVMSYSLAEAEQGKGVMYEAASSAIAHLFEDLNLHRITANYMPHNRRSGNLLRRLGFTVEGYARDYLQINGNWEDHILTSLINPAWKSELSHY